MIHTNLFKAIVFVLLVLFSSNIYAQHDTINYNFGIFINGNLGSLNPFNKDPLQSLEGGQDYLERAGGAIEKGAEILLFDKSGITLRAHVHSAKSIFKEINRGIDNDLKGTWSGTGQNIGIGYGDITKIKGRDFHLFLTIGYGSYSSQWEYFNDHFFEVKSFGDQQIYPGTRSTFSTRNNFLDFNAFFGKPKPFKKGESNFLWNSSLSIGYRQSLNRSNWTRDVSGAIVQGINPTNFISWYFTYSIGLGYIGRK